MRAVTPAPETNDDWVRAVRASDPGALEALRTTLLRGLRSGLSAKKLSDDVLQDFVQEAMVRIAAAIDRFRGQSTFRAWALSIAMRVAFEELRRARWKDVSLETPGDEAIDPPSDAPGAERDLARAQVLATLERAIDEALSPRQREVLLGELGGVPTSELAQRLGTNPNALYKLSHDARVKLKQAFAQAGLDASQVRWAFE